MPELSAERHNQLSEALIAADDILNVLIQVNAGSLEQYRSAGDVRAAWQKVRACSWLYAQQWYAERGMELSFDQLAKARGDDDPSLCCCTFLPEPQRCQPCADGTHACVGPLPD